MYYRTSGKDNGLAADRNKRALRGLVGSGVVPGRVGHLGGSLVGWISLSPREDYLKLRRSPIMKPVDDTRVCSVVCSYVARLYRGLGLRRQLLQAAMDFARDHGVRTLEAYPVDKPERSHDDFMFSVHAACMNGPGSRGGWKPSTGIGARGVMMGP
jgi:GNAT superfamily N-acetyltransferase